jgi:hypothetical protein
VRFLSPLTVSEQKKLSSHQWQLIDAVGNTVSLEQYKEN